MKKVFFAAANFTLLSMLALGVFAQDSKDKGKPATGTVDAWRSALPQSEQPANAVVVPEESKDNVEGEESVELTEKRIIELEQRLVESLKTRDSVSLGHLIADDFAFSGLVLPGNTADKGRYIKWVQSKLELKSYDAEKKTVRVFPNTAIVTASYKQQATVAGAPADGSFTVTNVWVKRDQLWRIVSHHVSPNP